MDITLVPSEQISFVWPEVKLLLDPVCSEHASAGEYTIEQIRMAIVRKERHLLVGVENDKIVGAMTIEFLNYPNKRVALISAFGGRRLVDVEDTPQWFEQIKNWCRMMGAEELRAYTKTAQTRLFSRLGFAKIYDVIGASL